MARLKCVRNLYDMKFTQYKFTGDFEQIFGHPSTSGCWLVYGAEKNGKTWCSLLVANYLSTFARVLYVSGEEGLDMGFTNACKRAKLDVHNRNLHLEGYVSIDELRELLKRRRSAKVIFLDNATIYADELKGTAFKFLMDEFPDKLFILVAHEEKGQPYTALARYARKLAKIILHVKGLRVTVSGRCPGGQMDIDETAAALYWGTSDNKKS